MKKINLKSDQSRELNQNNGGSLYVLVGALVLMITLGAYGWVSFQNNNIKKDISATEDELSNTKKSIAEMDLKDTYNFEKRLLALGDQMNVFSDQNENLNKIAVATFPETIFNSLIVEKDDVIEKYSINFTVPDLNFLVKQVKAFEGMVDVNINNFDFKGITFDEKGVTTEAIFNIINISDSSETEDIKSNE